MSLSFYKWISISTEILRNCLRSAEKKARIVNTADSHCTEIRTSSNINKQTTIDKRGRINLSYWNLCSYNDIGRVRVCDGAWLLVVSHKSEGMFEYSQINCQRQRRLIQTLDESFVLFYCLKSYFLTSLVLLNISGLRSVTKTWRDQFPRFNDCCPFLQRILIADSKEGGVWCHKKTELW